jgi:hypothetical protein
MNEVLFAFPHQAAVGHLVPKARILEHSQVRTKTRRLLIDEIERIKWAYKLAPETLLLSSTDQITEIQIFEILLKKRSISIDLLRAIDNAIPFPIFFELYFGDEVKLVAIPKRRNEADHAKWVCGEMLDGRWLSINQEREPLPVALDMQNLYESMLRQLLPLPQRRGETLKDQLERWALIGKKTKEIARLESRLNHEKQFNRKVEINEELKRQRAALSDLHNDGKMEDNG